MANILIMSSKSGNGHQKAAQALLDALSPKHNIYTDYTYEDTSKVYNWLVRHKFFRLIRFLYLFWDVREKLEHHKLLSSTLRFISLTHINLVISVSRGGNGAIWEACKAARIPLVIVPTDLDVEPFIKGMKDRSRNSHVFLTDYCQYPQVPLMMSSTVTGFPVQKCFIDYNDPILTCDNRGITKSFCLLQGYDMVDDVDYLAHHMPVREFVCVCNGDDDLCARLEELEHSNIIPILRETSAGMAALMQASFAVISKPGGAITGEALTLGVPLIIRSVELPWEHANLDFIRTEGHGYYWPGDIKNLECLLHRLVSLPANPSHITRDFTKNVNDAINRILEHR